MHPVVDNIAPSLPEIELGTSWEDRPTWKVPRGSRGRGFVLERAPHSTVIDPHSGETYPDLLVVTVGDADSKQALVQGDSPSFTIDHFRNRNAVLIQVSRLGELTRGEPEEVLTGAWLAVAPRGLVRQFEDR